MSQPLSKKLKDRAKLLGSSVSERHSVVGYTNGKNVFFTMDAAGQSTRTFTERFCAALISAADAAGRSDAAEAIRGLLGVPSVEEMRDAVEAGVDKAVERMAGR